MKLLLLDRPVDSGLISRREVEFFGPWAQPIQSPEDLVTPAFEPYPTPESVYEASMKSIRVARELLDHLAKIMPDLTGVTGGERFWKWLLAHHLLYLTGIVEDTVVRRASLPGKEYVLGLPAYSEVMGPPASWSGAEDLVSANDRFRQHAIGLCLRESIKDHELIEYCDFGHRKVASGAMSRTAALLSSKLAAGAGQLRSRFRGPGKLHGAVEAAAERCPSLIWDQYHLDGLDFAGSGAVVLAARDLPNLDSIRRRSPDGRKRDKIRALLPHPYGELLAMSLPIVALEGLSLLVEAAKEKAAAFGNVQRVYTHGQGFVNEGPGRVLLALLAEQGKRIVSIQHGALIYLAHPWMFLERNVADAYISWGSGYSHYDKLPGANNTKVLPSVHLSGLRRQASGGRRQKWDVLFVVLEEQRYTKWLYSPLFPDMARDYFSREKKLFDHFCVSKRAAVKVYSETFGWGQADWVKKRYPLAVLLSRGKFVDYAQQAKIVVVDYLSTAFLELLVMGRPFLATWNRRWFRGGDLFEKLLDRLAEAGVFHEQPESLIRSYAQTISPDIDRWWNESQRQGAVKEMADSFAMSSDTACEEWREEFQGESGWRGPSLERK